MGDSQDSDSEGQEDDEQDVQSGNGVPSEDETVSELTESIASADEEAPPVMPRKRSFFSVRLRRKPSLESAPSLE